MNFAKKRILKDISILQNANLNDSGIFFHVNETNLFEIYFLFLPRNNTPYEYGAYLFKLNADSSSYPFSPPKATFCSLGHQRIHPNFYSCGKVCLSILNTWSGPRWSPSQSLLSIALVIQSVFDECPLKHEPGFENDSHEQMNYNKFIQFENLLNVSRLLDLYESSITHITPFFSEFECFKEIIYSYYKTHFENIKIKINSLSLSTPSSTLFISVYQINIHLDFKLLSRKFRKHFKDYKLSLIDT